MASTTTVPLGSEVQTTTTVPLGSEVQTTTTFPLGSELQTTVPTTTVPTTTQTTIPQMTAPFTTAFELVGINDKLKHEYAEFEVDKTKIEKPLNINLQAVNEKKYNIPYQTTSKTVPSKTVPSKKVPSKVPTKASTKIIDSSCKNKHQENQSKISSDTDTLIKKGLVAKYDFLDKLDYQGHDPLYYINKGDLIDCSWDNQYSLVDSKHWKPYTPPPPVCVKQDTCEPSSTSLFMPYLELRHFDKKVTK